jgi:hypothetical protein
VELGIGKRQSFDRQGITKWASWAFCRVINVGIRHDNMGKTRANTTNQRNPGRP